jgi:hypothetical protein
MQLLVETGESLPDTNSYIEIADVEKYLPMSMYKKFLELSTDDQIDYVIIASMFIDYSFNWIGRRKTLEQGMSWPRIGAVFQQHEIPDDYIPFQIKRACATAILLIMQYGIEVFQDTAETQIKKEKLGALETEYFEAIKSYFSDSSEYSDINNILRGFFTVPDFSGVITSEVCRR